MRSASEGAKESGGKKRKQTSVLKVNNPKRKTAKTNCKYNKRHTDGTWDTAKPQKGTPLQISDKERANLVIKQPTTTRLERHCQMVKRFIEAMMSEITHKTSDDVEGEIFCLQCIYPNTQNIQDTDNFLAYKAISDPDTMYLHQAMKEPDKQHFIKAMEKEMNDQLKNCNFTKKL